MNDTPKSHALYISLVTGVICLMPILGVLAPRALSFTPSLLGLLAFFAYRPIFGAWPKIPNTLIFTLSSVVALAALSTFWAIEPDFALKRTSRIALVLLGALLLLPVLLTLPSAHWNRLKQAFPITFIIAAILSVIDLYTNGLIYQLLHGTIERLNPSSFNRGIIVLVVCTCPVLSILRSTNLPLHTRRILIAVVLMLIGAILYKTQSQSAQLALAVGGVFYLGFPTRIKAAWLALLGVLIALIWGAPWLASYMFDVLAARIDGIQWFKQSWAAHRMEIWDFIARRALEKPFLGHGIEATRAITDFDTQALYHPDSHILHPHNFALQLWIEFGILGVTMAAGFMAALMSYIKTLNASAARMYLGVLLTIISVSATGYGLWQGWWLGLLVLAAALTTITSKSDNTYLN